MVHRGVGSGRVGPTQELEPAQFYQSIDKQLADSAWRDLLIVLPGAGNSFDESLAQVAWFAHEIGFKGVSIGYSWPTGVEKSYPRDEDNSESSLRQLASFLTETTTRTTAKRIHLLASDIACRMVLNALAATSFNAPMGHRLDNLVLVAPDVEAKNFVALSASALAKTTRLTIYESVGVEALARGNISQRYRRAGDTSDGPTLVSGAEVVDAGILCVNLGPHFDLAPRESIRGDLSKLLVGGLPAARRGLVKSETGSLWKFPIRASRGVE